jgi:putative redox protein
MRSKVEFTSNGHVLRGLLQAPESGVRAYALFAHCFTCGKDIAAASRIARALTRRGIAVLRFDFTGLGSSDGDFANTNFSSNIQDLLAAVDYLRENHAAPGLLVGHSLGGAAVLAMADEVPEARAVVTIAAPYRAKHVVRHFAASLNEIDEQGEATVTLGQRQFRIQKQFLEDLEAREHTDIGGLRKALLIMHSPLDRVVPIDEAEKIYTAARHPKSFVSLDSADHLLTDKGDASYVAGVIAAWSSRYLPGALGEVRPAVGKGHVRVEEKNHKFTQVVLSDTHRWQADEPLAMGGDDSGPDPYEHLLAALGACTAMTLRMYAEHKSMPLEHVRVELQHSREHRQDCEDCDKKGAALEVIERGISLSGDLTAEQRARLLEIADKCPVHRTLHAELDVRTRVLD